MININALNILMLAISIVLLVLDCLQTLDIKNHPSLHEKNKILGKHPSDARIVIYFSVWIAASAATFFLCRPELSLLFFVILASVQLRVIPNNKRLGLRFTPWKNP